MLLQSIYAYSRSVEVLRVNRSFLLPELQNQSLLPLFEPQELVIKKGLDQFMLDVQWYVEQSGLARYHLLLSRTGGAGLVFMLSLGADTTTF